MDADDTLERLKTEVRFGPRMFEEMSALRLAAIAEIERLRARVAEIDRSTFARGYLVRNLIEPLAPGADPAPDLVGVCEQASAIAAELLARAEAAERERDALREALAGRAKEA